MLDTNGNTNGRAKDETDDGDMGDLGKYFIFLACALFIDCRRILIIYVLIFILFFVIIVTCLDFSIARMGLEDCEEVDDDIEARVQLDPSVWHPIKPNIGSMNMPGGMNLSNPMNMQHPFQRLGNNAELLLQQQHHHLLQQQVCVLNTVVDPEPRE